MILDAIQAIPPQYPIRVKLEDIGELTTTGLAEWVMNVVTLIIALAGLVISIIVYIKGKKDAEALNDSSRRLELFKTLVLDHIIERFHEKFESLRISTDQLRTQAHDQGNRQIAERAVQAHLRELNQEILALFRAISSELYGHLLEESDKCRDNIIETLADDSIQLDVDDNYNVNVVAHINNARESMIKYIYDFKG